MIIFDKFYHETVIFHMLLHSIKTLSLSIALLFAGFIFCACNRINRSAVRSRTELDKPHLVFDNNDIAQQWIDLGRIGEHDSLISLTKPIFEEALEKKDSVSAMWAAAFISQSYLLNDIVDSLETYIHFLKSYDLDRIPVQLRVTIDNILGIYSVKRELNYPKAISYLYDSYEWTEQEGDTRNSIIQLCNIVYLFYIRSDINGLHYARMAGELAEKENIDCYYKHLSCIALSEMYLVGEQNDSSWFYISQANDISEENGYHATRPIINLIKAELYSSDGNFRKAYGHYEDALHLSEYTDPGTTSLIYLRYGQSSLKNKDYEKATYLFLKGLENSECSHNLEFRMELLLELSDIRHITGDEKGSIEYFRKYRLLSDSLAIDKMEKEFNNLLVAYAETEHSLKIKDSEIALLKANRRILVILFLATVFMLTALFLLLRYRKSKEMYRSLVKQYQARLEEKECMGESRYSPDSELWERLERLMQNNNCYRQKDLTLDRTAEILGSNRTYLSRAVNTFAKIDFNSYVNRYRIRASIKMMQDDNKKTPFKEIADAVGFKSLQSFYNAFQKETGCSPGKYRTEMAQLSKDSGNIRL